MNEEIESKESGFSRRRVVKGVAWSVPVIVTAVASPAAAASPGQVDPLLDPNTAIKFVLSTKPGSPGQARNGLGPKGFYIHNSGGAPTGAISGRITVTSSDSSAPRVGVQILSEGVLDQIGASDTGFTIAGGVGAGVNKFFSLTFNHTEPPRNWVGPKSFELAISFTSPVGLDKRFLGGALELR
ncbi:hypothetical protein [Pseudarthrobacter chlorophenolicus]|uniref:hypothetical protein n=1 Tax=Pseudarthrobacter chlorophenolicus TaxID=85085 RepID=UPI00126A247D|nr:hypothetical protein [Pseudarthrobacter chlorophenolicus]